MKKIISILMSALMLVTLVATNTGCNKSDGPEIDETKTQLYVSNNDQGVGRSFIEKIGEAFTQDFANYSFEEGKRGVQIMYNHNTAINADPFYVTMENDTDNIYFTEGVDYIQYSSKFYNLTEEINNKVLKGVASDGSLIYEDYTINSLLNPTYKLFADRDASAEGEDYRAVPLYLATKSLIYDKDLWNEYGFYFAKNGCPSEIIVKAVNDGSDIQTAVANYKQMLSGSINDIYFVNDAGYNGQDNLGKSAGPDGEYNTMDDGLPATYDEFYLLMNVMSSKVTPILWSGGNPQYADMLTTALWTNYMGTEQLEAYYSLNGTVSDLVKLDSNGKIVMENGEPKIDDPITFDGGLNNGYEIQRTAGKYYALKFMNQIVKNSSKWTSNVCWGTESQTGTQSVFLTYGKTDTAERDIAMLIDGGWWQQEATATFDNMASVDAKYSKQNRNFGILSLPNATTAKFVERIGLDGAEDKNPLVVTNDSYCFINNNLKEGSPQLKAAKMFFSYFHSKKALDIFAKETSMTRALEYNNYSQEGMTPYCKNYVDFVNSCDIVYPYTTNNLMNNNRTMFANSPDAWNWCSKTSAGDAQNPLKWLKDHSAVTPENYFEGLYKYYSSKWSTLRK